MTTENAQPSPAPVNAHMPTTDEWWHDGAKRAAIHALAQGRQITADDLFDEPYGLPDPRHGSQVGGLFAGLHRSGLARPVGFNTSKRQSRNGGIQRIWSATAKLKAQLAQEQAQPQTTASKEAA